MGWPGRLALRMSGDVASGAHGIALRWEALGYLSGAAFGTAADRADHLTVDAHLGAADPLDDQAHRR